MHLALGVTGYDENHKDKYALNLLSVILGGNMSSRLFIEIREKRGLAYSISCAYKALHDTGIFLIRAGIDNNKLIDATKLIIRELNKIKRSGVASDEFSRARDYLIGQLSLSLEDTLDHMLWIGEGMISRNKTRALKEVIKRLETIKPADIKRVAKDVLRANNLNLAVVGPMTQSQEKQLSALIGA
jgi:predicted Zn-dependent peptidase